MGATGHPTSHPCGRSSSLPTTLASDVRRPGLRSTRSRYRLDRPHAGSDPVGPTATAQQGSAEPRGIDALGSRVPRPPIPTPCGARAGGEPATRVSLPLCPRLASLGAGRWWAMPTWPVPPLPIMLGCDTKTKPAPRLHRFWSGSPDADWWQIPRRRYRSTTPAPPEPARPCTAPGMYATATEHPCGRA